MADLHDTSIHSTYIPVQLTSYKHPLSASTKSPRLVDVAGEIFLYSKSDKGT
jgi:hypothetical protein